MVRAMATQVLIDPSWWDTENIGDVPLREVLARHDMRALFQFLHRRGVSWGAISRATDIGEQRVREIANGRRRIESYDVYVRIAVGLNIPREYLGVGVAPAGAARHRVVAHPDDPAADAVRQVVRGVNPMAADGRRPDPHRFEAEVLTAWSQRRRQDHCDTVVTLVAGFAGSGKTEFARFLSAVTGWALLDKDVLTRPMVEELLVAMNLDPNDRHSVDYRTKVRPVEYRSLMGAAFANIDNAVSTVVTAPFLAEVDNDSWIRWLMHRCAVAPAHLEVVWVHADPETMRTYLQRRDAARDTWKLNQWDEYLDSIDLALRPRVPHFFIDNSLGSSVRLADEALRVSEWVTA